MNESDKETKFGKATERLRSLTSGAIRLSLIILFGVLAWRIAWSNFSLDLTKFDFSDLLAMILALFAMAMSVAFYFKSTDSSNQFYDNIYNFTQKTSEILGRIEERFGERLKHLDEGIQTRFDGISKTPGEIQKKVKETEGKEEKEKEKLEETNKAMRQMMDQLAERARLEQQEKEDFYQKMSELESEKNMAQERIRDIEEDRDQMRNQLMMMEKDMMGDSRELHNSVINELLRHDDRLMHLLRRGASSSMLQKHSHRIFSDLPDEYQDRLRNDGIINNENELTPAGCIMLRSISRRYR